MSAVEEATKRSLWLGAHTRENHNKKK